MQEAANDPIVEQVASGRDVRLEGPAASVRLEAVAARLEDSFNVVRLTAPRGGLSLSALIAQLSGRERFDEHDDGALEAGFRRLCGTDAPERGTVLLLDATQGVQRPVLRYLQQAAHNAPGLRFVIASFAELPALLEAPDMARLRSRLGNVVTAEELPAETPGRALVVVPAQVALAPVAGNDDAVVDWTLGEWGASDWASVSRERALLRRRRRVRRTALTWTTSALALAASVAFGAWLGQARTETRGGGVVSASKESTAAPDRRAELTLRPVLAHVGAPTLATPVAPAPARANPMVPAAEAIPRGTPASVPMPALAKPTAPEVAASGDPPAAVKPEPAMTFASVEERLSAMTLHSRAAEARRAAVAPVRPRVAARTRAPTRYSEEDRPLPEYGSMELPPDDALPDPAPRPGRATREPVGREYGSYARELARPYEGDPGVAGYEPSRDGPYIGTFSTGPYGARVFRYGP